MAVGEKIRSRSPGSCQELSSDPRELGSGHLPPVSQSPFVKRCRGHREQSPKQPHGHYCLGCYHLRVHRVVTAEPASDLDANFGPIQKWQPGQPM
ncbi:hypothetical protein QTO34_014314 [Cnephaeus nilssonii]|uniref:Uncharacterized protein n=1 Tax=Cnephaeus nilssonii TaxID=3371016 RepID=A0AA40I6Z2_CNENI|nr:hypothetical protein QTO34_014314 [Eptesicus nilssonii]